MANDPAGTTKTPPAPPAPPAANDAGQIPPSAPTKTDEAAQNKIRSRGLHFLQAVDMRDADKIGRMLRGADK